MKSPSAPVAYYRATWENFQPKVKIVKKKRTLKKFHTFFQNKVFQRQRLCRGKYCMAKFWESLGEHAMEIFI